MKNYDAGLPSFSDDLVLVGDPLVALLRGRPHMTKPSQQAGFSSNGGYSAGGVSTLIEEQGPR
jgi:hypothetical protein